MTVPVVTLNSRVDGQGPVLVLMHGLFGSHRNWFSVQRRLSAQWQVHALDLRNHGQSGWSDDMDYDLMSRDVIAYLDEQQVERAVLLGHSMGGKVAMSAVLAHPERIDALVIVDIAPVTYQPTLRPYLQAMLDMPLADIRSRRDADDFLQQAVPEDGVRGFLLQNLVADGNGGYQWRINLATIDVALQSLGDLPAGMPAGAAAEFAGPVQAIYGSVSSYMQAPARTAMQQLFPQAELVRIDAAGHWVHAEQPDAFFSALSTFLDKIRPAG